MRGIGLSANDALPWGKYAGKVAVLQVGVNPQTL